jgi:uncharacterized sulfatase
LRLIVLAAIAGAAAFPFLSVTPAGMAAEKQRPNFLIIIGDDATHNDLPLYGGQNVKTPHIDRLAREGLTFDHAYLAMSMCNPCRTELYTGLYPARSGVCWNHSAARPGTKSVVAHLGQLGYRVGLTGKKHAGPPASFRFEAVPGVEGGCVSQTAKFDDAGIREFISRDQQQPFCLVVGLVVPHSPWTVGNPDNFPFNDLKLPPHLVDTPTTREDFAKYLAEIEVLDQHVGRVLAALDQTGQRDRTLVLFTSEQGAQFPGCKWTNWNLGVHTGFVARWPGRIKPGHRTDALIQYADVLPTLVDAAGGDPAAGEFDGSSFLPVLLGQSDRHREFAYFMHNNIPEGPPYPIRAVTDGTHHYIRNLKPEALYIEKHLMGQHQWHQYWPSWVFATTFNEHARATVQRYMRRPAEELYQLRDDPFELNNLAGDSDCDTIKTRLAKELERWMRSQRDPGAAIDTQSQWKASKRGEHFGRGTAGTKSRLSSRDDSSCVTP